MNRFVSEMIGDNYKTWKSGDNVLITTGTGSGKTYFILHTLLRYAREKGKHLVYYCNRRFLSMQVQAYAEKEILRELDADSEGLADYLHIRTYQKAERHYDYPNIHALNEDGTADFSRYDAREGDILYYIFDEAFYFVADAGFNSNTYYWCNGAIGRNKKSISIFLAATPEPLRLFWAFQVEGTLKLSELCKRYLTKYCISRNAENSEILLCDIEPSFTNLLEERYQIIQESPYYRNYYREEEVAEEIRKTLTKKMQEYMDPCKELVDEVTKIYSLKPEYLNYCYQDERTIQERYNYLDVYYFNDMASLANQVADSVQRNCNLEEGKKQRWLIFVRKIEDATLLSTCLGVLKCDSVIISRDFTKDYDGKKQGRGLRRRVFGTLIHEEKLACDVLISTSVLDCGISLRAENVCNLVICQPNKTSFLQMLGRIRVHNGQRVNLYVQSFTPKEINGHITKAEKLLRNLCVLYVGDRRILKEEGLYKYRYTGVLDTGLELIDENNPKFRESLVPKKVRNEIQSQLQGKFKRGNYIYSRIVAGWKEEEFNPLAIINCLDEIHLLRSTLSKYFNDPYFFLKEQLSWIGQTYDSARWITYEEQRSELHKYLEEKCEAKEPMDKKAQQEFRKKCLSEFRKMENLPPDIQKIKYRFPKDSEKTPGREKLNEIFLAANLPYEIQSKQNKGQLIDRETGEVILDPHTGKPKIDNKSYWTVVRADLGQLRRKAEEKEMRLAAKKAQCAAQEKEAENPPPQDPAAGMEPVAHPEAENPARRDSSESNRRGGMKVAILRGDKPYFQSDSHEIPEKEA